MYESKDEDAVGMYKHPEFPGNNANVYDGALPLDKYMKQYQNAVALEKDTVKNIQLEVVGKSERTNINAGEAKPEKEREVVNT
jgi:hypothetical protein